jgi:hypothetical protein
MSEPIEAPEPTAIPHEDDHWIVTRLAGYHSYDDVKYIKKLFKQFNSYLATQDPPGKVTPRQYAKIVKKHTGLDI